MKKLYVVGFQFSKYDGKVVLIRKTHPEWQNGKLNGTGGHIEQGETPKEAMIREHYEEAGLRSEEWEQFCTLVYPKAKVYCFRMWSNSSITTKTDEPVAWYKVYHLPSEAIHNLHWLIPLALHDDIYLKQVIIPPSDQSEVRE